MRLTDQWGLTRGSDVLPGSFLWKSPVVNQARGYNPKPTKRPIRILLLELLTSAYVAIYFGLQLGPARKLAIPLSLSLSSLPVCDSVRVLGRA